MWSSLSGEGVVCGHEWEGGCGQSNDWVNCMLTARPIYLKSIPVHFAPCIFLIMRDVVGRFFSFYTTEITITIRSSRFCSKSVGTLTQKLAVLPYDKYCTSRMCEAWLDPTTKEREQYCCSLLTDKVTSSV